MSGHFLYQCKRLHELSPAVIPDLFLFDVLLPDGSGVEVCNYVKSNEPTSTIPVVLMSAHAKAIETDRLCQPDAFIVKPFDIDDVISTVSRLVKD
ncbi:response regulator [Chryseobacterium taichungense]|uniref:response regulator n=1 Tax=Chryseobacterium taichungense TaxID=295069 RepID=UPI0035E4348E